MGRPPKKRSRVDDEVPELTHSNVWQTPEDTPPEPPFEVPPHFPEINSALEAREICPLLFWQNQPESQLPMGDDKNNMTWGMPPERLKNPLPSSTSDWPDFSTVSQASGVPIPNFMDFTGFSPNPLTPPDDTENRQCTCLSHLYLCLSNLSSMAAFPITDQTICSLQIMARTASEVIRCETCPKNFATGIQNVMFTGTLLTVLADAWLRMYQSDPVELGLQHAPSEFIDRITQCEDPAQGWKNWLRQTVRKGVVGGNLDPAAFTRCSEVPSILQLIIAVEDRQRRWHEPGKHPVNDNHFSMGGLMGNQDCQKPLDEKELLCMRVVGSARQVLKKFNFGPEDFPDGVIPACFENNH